LLGVLPDNLSFTNSQRFLAKIVTCKLKKEPPYGQAHLVFANAKPNAEKSKELALPHRHPNGIITFYTQFYEISKIN